MLGWHVAALAREPRALWSVLLRAEASAFLTFMLGSCSSQTCCRPAATSAGSTDVVPCTGRKPSGGARCLHERRRALILVFLCHEPQHCAVSKTTPNMRI
jgi:hypothetical protein